MVLDSNVKYYIHIISILYQLIIYKFKNYYKFYTTNIIS